MSAASRAPLYATLAGALLLSGCGGHNNNRTVYCVDQNGKVVPMSQCDRPNSAGVYPYYYWYGTGGNHAYSGGQTVPLSSGTRVSPGDSAARTQAGLPASGPVKASSGGFGAGIRSATGSSGHGSGFGGFGHGSGGGHGGGS